jgi:hypothetical protein
VALFATCYCNRNEPDIDDDLAVVFRHNCIPVSVIPQERCCGSRTESRPGPRGKRRARIANRIEVEHMSATPATPGAKLRPEDLYSLEQYAKQRPQFRPKVIAHKRERTPQCGPNATWCFEDRLTVQY